ncbi:hypothetical protein KOY_00279 [Bacillus cereus VDM021]|nr:hypothetical protein KOY_00279 [Bacillus cereus VDM021]
MKELRSHQVFDSLDQLNEFTSKVLSQVEMNETDRNVFVMLSRYSVKVLGVCWLKVNTIAEALEVSYKTVQRSLARLVKKNIIKRVETMRAVSGGYGASLTVMSPIGLSYREEAVEPCVGRVQDEPEQEETIPLKQRPKRIHIRTNEMDSSFAVACGVPSQFANLVSSFVPAHKVVSLWRKATVIRKRYAPLVEDCVGEAVQAIKISVMAVKLGKVKDIGAYYWGTLSRILAREQRKICLPQIVNIFD